MRVGMGYDVHKLTENRELILGGVKIPYEKGLLGHSDADVLLHAIMDALLGAAALGDIGSTKGSPVSGFWNMWRHCWMRTILLWKISMQRSSPSVRRCFRIFLQCGKI